MSNSRSAPEAHTSAPHDPLPAFEQFGRIDILEGGLAGSPFVNVSLLANLAQQQLDSGHADNAATLLRAAEHLSFAALAPKNSARLTAHIPHELRAAVVFELDRLTNAAKALWAESAKAVSRAVIETIYATALEDARQAFDRGAYRPALHLARAAEALAHISAGLPTALPGDRELTRRLAS
jgi:hypothetical protein